MEEQLYIIHDNKRPDRTPGKPYPVHNKTAGMPDDMYVIRDDFGEFRITCLGPWGRLAVESDLTTKERMAAGLPVEDVLCGTVPDRRGFSEKSTEEVVIDLLKRVNDLEQNDALARIEALEKQVVEVVGVPEEQLSAEWPQVGDTVWIIDTEGHARHREWREGGFLQYFQRDFLGIYPTQEDAERRVRKIQTIAQHLNKGYTVKLDLGNRYLTIEP